MSVVVDLGCYTHPRYPEDESTHRLIERFEPDVYVGFDPHPDVVPLGADPPDSRVYQGNTAVTIRREAAWIHDGTIAYDPRPDRPLAAAVGKGPLVVPCFDLASWMAARGFGHGDVVLKMDVEGAEYVLLRYLILSGAIRLVKLLLVEWHRPPVGPTDWEAQRDVILPGLTCEVEEW